MPRRWSLCVWLMAFYFFADDLCPRRRTPPPAPFAARSAIPPGAALSMLPLRWWIRRSGLPLLCHQRFRGTICVRVSPARASTPRAPSPRTCLRKLTPQLHVAVGATFEVEFKLQVGGAKETITVSSEPPLVETQSNAVSSLVDKRAIEELPLDGRRFTDLALLRRE